MHSGSASEHTRLDKTPWAQAAYRGYHDLIELYTMLLSEATLGSLYTAITSPLAHASVAAEGCATVIAACAQKMQAAYEVSDGGQMVRAPRSR